MFILFFQSEVVALSSSEISWNFYQAASGQSPEDGNLNSHYRNNLKSHRREFWDPKNTREIVGFN